MTTVNSNDPHVAKTGDEKSEKKRLTNEVFARVTRSLNVGKQTLDIAYGVLVEGDRRNILLKRWIFLAGLFLRQLTECGMPINKKYLTALCVLK